MSYSCLGIFHRKADDTHQCCRSSLPKIRLQFSADEGFLRQRISSSLEYTECRKPLIKTCSGMLGMHSFSMIQHKPLEEGVCLLSIKKIKLLKHLPLIYQKIVKFGTMQNHTTTKVLVQFPWSNHATTPSEYLCSYSRAIVHLLQSNNVGTYACIVPMQNHAITIPYNIYVQSKQYFQGKASFKIITLGVPALKSYSVLL